MKKVFVVSEYVYPEQNSTGYFWAKLIKKASQCFAEVTVIHSGDTKKNADDGRAVEYLGIGSVKYNKNNLLSRIGGQLRQCFLFSKKIVQSVSKGDVVLTGTNPAIMLFMLPVLKRFIRFKWCLLVHDVFPENLVPAGVLQKKSYFYRFLNKIFNLIYSQADHLVVIGRDMEDLMAKKIGDTEKITVVRNWVSDKDVYPIPRVESEIIIRLGWQKRLVFQFFGNIGRVQDVENILAAIRMVKSPSAAFVFIGDGAAAASVREFVDSYEGSNVSFLGSIDQAKKNDGLAACDVAMITLKEGMLGLGVPSKAYFSMAADKPLLAVMESGAEVARMVEETGIGWVCKPSDPKALALMIDDICAQGINSMYGRSRKALQERYSEEAALEQFSLCIGSLLSSASLKANNE